MKIALLTDGVHPYVIGGMQKHSFHLVVELARNKHTVYLFHCNESKYDASKLEFFTEEERQYIKPFLIPFPHKAYFPFHYIYESKLYSRAIYEALIPHLSEIDFIFAQGFCAWELLEHKRTLKLPPVAIHFHGLEMFQHIPSAKVRISRYFLQLVVRANLKKANYAISFGGRITTILEALIPKERIWEINGGIEQSWLSHKITPARDLVHFIFIGRYERRKGLQELNLALKNILSSAHFYFDFIGNIPNKYKLSAPNLVYHGQITSEDAIKEILSQNDVLICPSFAEGMPIVIMEAMAQGLAIIATDVGSISTLVDNNNGWLLQGPEPNYISLTMLDAINKKDILYKKKKYSIRKIKEAHLINIEVQNLLKKIQASIEINKLIKE